MARRVTALPSAKRLDILELFQRPESVLQPAEEAAGTFGFRRLFATEHAHLRRVADKSAAGKW
jgi:uncharacterized protein Yka (UPF0111/DUF47 family)